MEEYTQRLTESSWDNKEWICSICGRQNKEEFKYCPECGEKKPDHEETQTEITIKKLKRKGFENCEQLFRLLIHVEDEEGNLLGSYNIIALPDFIILFYQIPSCYLLFGL
jgi:hypothetical protein